MSKLIKVNDFKRRERKERTRFLYRTILREKKILMREEQVKRKKNDREKGKQKEKMVMVLVNKEKR